MLARRPPLTAGELIDAGERPPDFGEGAGEAGALPLRSSAGDFFRAFGLI